MKLALPICAAMFLMGCMREPEPAPVVLPPIDSGLETREPDSCGAAALEHLIGQTEGMLRTVVLKQTYRVVPVGALVTQEYNAGRVNFYLDDTGRIAQVRCG